jgi:hypothetical protein
LLTREQRQMNRFRPAHAQGLPHSRGTTGPDWQQEAEMHALITADRGPALVLRLGLQRLIPLAFVLAALVVAAAVVQAVSAM